MKASYFLTGFISKPEESLTSTSLLFFGRRSLMGELTGELPSSPLSVDRCLSPWIKVSFNVVTPPLL